MNIDITVAIAVMQLLLTVVAVLIGWLVKGLFDKIKSMEAADKEVAKEVSGMRESLPMNYVRRDDFKELSNNIFDALRRIEGRVQTLAERAH